MLDDRGIVAYLFRDPTLKYVAAGEWRELSKTPKVRSAVVAEKCSCCDTDKNSEHEDTVCLWGLGSNIGVVAAR